ncbi:SRPBCC family protein [Pedobacter cryophilus]|uniref:SRPBCC domain-containing protein n=1 Tax=Pedobacter cryophilus TaxID=2571271 RepID=A0A4U1BZ64_9SPHI|nr:SRPBCC family protein [Pedobacter cryophilus]TKB97909.1 SRPBCC domain-containing protein [Pedobacter cryophilus]
MMNHNLVVSKSVIVYANRNRVWEVLTNPQIIKEYLFGTETITDWKVGSEIIFQGDYDGHQYKDHGVITENIPTTKLSYSYWSGFSGMEDKPENYSKVTYLLADKRNNQTEFTWIQEGYANEEVYQHSKSGMDEFIESIKLIMER